MTHLIDFAQAETWLARFLAFPAQLYAADPNWLPDPSAGRLLQGAYAPTARWRNFLALDGDEVRGRVTAMIDARLSDAAGQPLGMLGFFECVDELALGQSLIEAARNWLRAAVPECRTVVGPLNFDTWHAYRLRVSDFDQPTFAGEPYNPVYYPALFEAAGFAPTTHYETKTIGQPEVLLARWDRSYLRAARSGFTFRPFNPAALTSELALLYRLATEIFRPNPFFAEIPEAEFRALYTGKGAGLLPDMLLFALDPQGEPVGFSFAFPDARQPHTANLKTLGLLPRWHGLGLGGALLYETYRRLLAHGFMQVQHCLMLAGNQASLIDKHQALVTRTYALYARTL